MSETQAATDNRSSNYSEAFKQFICTDWAPYSSELPAPLPAAGPAVGRRAKLAAQFPGKRLVIPAGGPKARNNDCDYRFRPDSAFAHLTGLGTDKEPNAVLVIEPSGQSVLYFHPRVDRTDKEFYADSRYGEMWVGQRVSVAEMQALCGFACTDDSHLETLLTDGTPTLIMREVDPDITAIVDKARGGSDGGDDQLRIACSELRLIKDDFELSELRRACDLTALAFEAVVKQLGQAAKLGHGERWVEGIFGLHARHTGNAVGYDTIAAAGDHANTLHWIRNEGDIRSGDLLLMDAGIEVDSLYTADITRTMPINGVFTPEQRQVYDLVRAAQQAGMDVAKPGARFTDVHKAAVSVLAHTFEDWGILPVTAEEALADDGGQYRRWMVHNTSHMLGLDVHDCAHALRENYKDSVLKPGMVLTVEPGVYIKASDLVAPPELRGIGVRIEDDIVITETGCEILSDALPRESADVEAWMAGLLG